MLDAQLVAAGDARRVQERAAGGQQAVPELRAASEEERADDHTVLDG